MFSLIDLLCNRFQQVLYVPAFFLGWLMFIVIASLRSRFQQVLYVPVVSVGYCSA